MNNPREFDKVYSIDYLDNKNGNYVVNNNYYLDGYPFLNNVKVKGISIKSFIDSKTLFLTISDKNKNQVLYNFPFQDLITNTSTNNKLRLFNIDGVYLLNSYFSFNTVPIVVPRKMFTLSFYY